MARPRSRPVAQPGQANETVSTFVDALRFVSVATKKEGAPFETHVNLSANWARAFNGLLAAGHPIAEEVFACPHNETLIAALKECKEAIAIMQLDRNRLAVKSGKFRAVVPCIDPDMFGVIEPDIAVAPIDDRFKAGIAAVGILASENGQQVIDASLLIRSGSVVATNRLMLFEYWHGIDLPTMSLPKAAVAAIVNQEQPLKAFGVSASSCTFHYANGGWIRSQFWSDQWPTIDNVLNKPCNPWPVPEGFFAAVKAIMDFSTSGNLYFFDGVLRSHDNEAQGASYEVKGLPGGPIFNAKRLKMLEPFAKQIDFMANGEKMLSFVGDNIRGVVAGM